MRQPLFRLMFAISAVAATLAAQGGVTGIPGMAPPPPTTPQPAQPTPAPAPKTGEQRPAAPGQTQTTPAQPGLAPLTLDSNMPFIWNDVSLTEVIDMLAQRLHMKYLLDPRVKGSVTIHTYGEVKAVELMPLLQTILRVNGMAMVQVGDLWRILPAASISALPIEPLQTNDPKTLPDDERMVMNLLFLKYTTAKEMDTLLGPFMGEHHTSVAYDPANLLIIEDNSRSMRRTMELIAMFDSETFASKRVHLFDIVNSRPSDLAKELDNVMKAYSATDKSGVRFMPIDRINTLIAVAPNPGVFEEVQRWIEKLDVKAKVTSGSTDMWVYQLKYQRAEILALAIQALYSGNTAALVAMYQMLNQSMYSSGIGNNGTGYGMGGGMGMGMGTGGFGNSLGIGGLGTGGYGGGGMGFGTTSNYGNGYAGGSPYAAAPLATMGQNPQQQAGGADATGTYLGNQPGAQGGTGQHMPQVVPNPFNNTLMIRGTAQEFEQISNMLRQLDVAPRQVLIDAKIYEVDLDNEFAAGVESYLQNAGSSAATGVTNNGVTGTGTQSVVSGLSPAQALTAAAGPGGLALTVGAMVSNSKQLLGLLTAQENRGRSRVISSPSIIATDGIPATMNIGSQVPVLTSQLATGVQSGGNTQFANTVSSQSAGVTLSITPRVSSSGVVTMIINQQVTAPVAPAASATIQSPSFSNRSLSTQLTIMDGDTVAIGGAIVENHTESSGGVPFLHRLPIIGSAFGAKSYSTQRTELIVFLTPRVIYDSNALVDATEELKNEMKRVGELMKDDQ
jgi:general secretion pathway protein D